MIGETLQDRSMIEARAKEGYKAMGAWMSRSRCTGGELNSGTFRRIVESLVESVLLYGSEAWGCSRHAYTGTTNVFQSHQKTNFESR